MTRPVLWLTLFLLVLAGWTWKLLEPNPLPPVVKELVSWSDWFAFALAKCLHAGVYAILAILGRGAVSTPAARVGVVWFLLLHGGLTELGQTFVPNRHGTWKDVGLDAVGTLLGAWFSRRWLER